MPEATGAGGSRRDARERALHLLYEAEMKGCPPADVLADLPLPADPYAEEVVAGVGESLDELDALIARRAKGWELHRMPALDRALLRLATYELAHRPDVPRNVVLNEAVELAKTYGTDDSPRFVNGVLAALADELRGPG